MAISGVNHITLAVSDLSRSLQFYEDVLGARRAAIWPRGAYLELGTLWLCLEVSTEMSPRGDDSHIALSCSPGGFADLARKIAASARLWKDNRSEGASLYFLDPDGHKLELHEGDLASRLAHYRTHPAPGMTLTDAKTPS
ncbi:glutathione transferase [Rhodophyticola sp. CCM32]|uniref:VOC family protein n=1 Tax=Rhodophyticola sp. CCM32 TaxID=2916397 RepID=UPI00107EF576|nr:VOC family protein [Rhodophyticola sp. CCM32]QBX99760.1 glutathione transferase [Rhodophyticola sp. CCM32]